MKKRKFIIDHIEDVDSFILTEMLGVYRDSLQRIESSGEHHARTESFKTSLEVIQRELHRRSTAQTRGEA